MTTPSKNISPHQRHLNEAQCQQLKTVLHETFIMDPFDSFNFPQLYVDPCSLLLTVQNKLQKAGIRVISTGIVGGAASYVIAKEAVSYADLDLLVQVDFPKHQHHEKFNTIRTCTLEILRDAFYKQSFASAELNPLGLETLSRMYVLKMMKIPQIHQVESSDYWSLICFRNREGRNIELKFEHTMHRAYEFSSHSFVIWLNNSFLQRHARCDPSKGEIGHVDLMKHPKPASSDSAIPDDKPVELIVKRAELASSDSADSASSDDNDKSSDSGDTPNTTTTNTDNELDQVYIDEDKFYVEDSGSSTGSSNHPSRRNSLSSGYQTNDDAQAWGVEPLTDKTKLDENNENNTSETDHEPIVVESYYINFDEAVKHLNKRQICVYRPEEIRGGGFLKYCHLVFRGWTHLGQDSELRAHERDVMAIRFSIDFPGEAAVWRALKCYVDCHFWRERELTFSYLEQVRQTYSRTNVSNKTPLVSLIEHIFLRNQYLAFQFAATSITRQDNGAS